MRRNNLISTVLINPLQRIVGDSRSVGIILFACSIVSIMLANTSFGEQYIDSWSFSFHFPGSIHLPHSLLHWINDGAMAVFFFLVGMEIKRELLEGELSSVQQSLLPVFAAIGGMVVPAILYTLFNKETVYQHGWGIPMATDIAFSLGVASMLGKRVPGSLKVFLTALAIIDDLGAILVIALFYGAAVNWLYLLAGGIAFTVLLLLPRLKIRFGWWNYLLGILLWYCIYNSGIHATIAGVLFAFTIPVSQLSKQEHRLHVPVNFIILPVFALANTAIAIPSDFAVAFGSSLSYGIIAGLFLGKPLGILLACWCITRLKWGRLPEGVSWMQMAGIGILAGIGFTMSIFISMLAFTDQSMQDMAKVGVLLASLLAIVTGYLWLMVYKGKE
ncbi:MAG: Na+/H+ antiporter NhaA [Sphingobacteriales bacterium 44-15]|nr:MAG: Na+/H+ antiporter NhaA [Sphingobacteriales bacterium 44-15]